jgi:hypothetical protein
MAVILGTRVCQVLFPLIRPADTFSLGAKATVLPSGPTSFGFKSVSI